MNEVTIIHAIGRVQTGLDGYDQGFIETIIIWKNISVGDKVPDKYEENFDVLYDSSYEL